MLVGPAGLNYGIQAHKLPTCPLTMGKTHLGKYEIITRLGDNRGRQDMMDEGVKDKGTQLPL